MYHETETCDTDEYTRSIEVNRLLARGLDKEWTYTARQWTNCSESKDDYVYKDRVFNFLDTYKDTCAIKPRSKTNYPDRIGYDANIDTIYTLDDYNTYHNYPVCVNKEQHHKHKNGHDTLQKCCAPKNVQIFDNCTKKTNEYAKVAARSSHFIVETVDETIPSSQYATCHVPIVKH